MTDTIVGAVIGVGGTILGGILSQMLSRRIHREVRGDPLALELFKAQLAAFREIQTPLDFAFLILLGYVHLKRTVAGTFEDTTLKWFMDLRLKSLPFEHVLPKAVLDSLSKFHDLRAQLVERTPFPDDAESRVIAAVTDIRNEMRRACRVDAVAERIASLLPPATDPHYGLWLEKLIAEYRELDAGKPRSLSP